MANKRSAKKAIKQSSRRQVFNLRRKRAMKSAEKSTRELISAGNKKEAVELLPKLYKALDKATKQGVIKKNTAARKKSRLTKAVGKM